MTKGHPALERKERNRRRALGLVLKQMVTEHLLCAGPMWQRSVGTGSVLGERT